MPNSVAIYPLAGMRGIDAAEKHILAVDAKDLVHTVGRTGPPAVTGRPGCGAITTTHEPWGSGNNRTILKEPAANRSFLREIRF